MGDIRYEINGGLGADEFITVLETSTLGERRPVDDRVCIEAMVDHANLTVCARDGARLVGVARSVTDFGYCCYLSDLAVDRAYQGRGIGRRLIELTRERLRPTCTLILLSAPAAVGYYPRLGFQRHDQAWVLRPGDDLQ